MVSPLLSLIFKLHFIVGMYAHEDTAHEVAGPPVAFRHEGREVRLKYTFVSFTLIKTPREKQLRGEMVYF